MIQAVIIGASGYTGIELVRLLMHHPEVTIAALCANQKAGQAMHDIYPHLEGQDLPPLVTADAVDWAHIDVAFCCLPHGTSQEVILEIPEKVKIIDLSADFRLRNIDTYAQWYEGKHRAPVLQKEAIYGLSEYYRAAIATARLVACPGCYPTATLLPLIPLLREGLIEPQVITDAKSGVTGAGRSLKEGLLFTELNDSIMAYSVGKHRHLPEIQQELSQAHGGEVAVTFTPHLVPMNRGILATSYVHYKAGTNFNRLREALNAVTMDEPFLHLLPEDKMPSTRGVRGSNHVQINLFEGSQPHQAILVSVIDNLTKGSSGQAVQNMNLMFDVPEVTGLEHLPLFP